MAGAGYGNGRGSSIDPGTTIKSTGRNEVLSFDGLCCDSRRRQGQRHLPDLSSGHARCFRPKSEPFAVSSSFTFNLGIPTGQIR